MKSIPTTNPETPSGVCPAGDRALMREPTKEREMKTAQEILDEIESANLEDGEVAYVDGRGEWILSTDGNQPSNTFPISYVDLNCMSPNEIEEYLDEFLTR